MKWLLAAAEQGLPRVQSKLSELCADGFGQLLSSPRDRLRARDRSSLDSLLEGDGFELAVRGHGASG
jgi:hypothetical protein